MRFFLAYLREKWLVFAAFILCVLVFCASFFLYKLPVAAVLYPAAICLFLLAAFFFFGYFRALYRHKIVRHMADTTYFAPDELVRLQTLCDRDYRDLADMLYHTQKQEEADYAAKVIDMTEYYTTWVHQIKTPIASMYLTLENEDTPVSRRMYDDLFRIEQYVGMVLTYLRLDSQSSDYVFRMADVDAVIRQSVRKFASQFISGGLSISLRETKIKIVTDEKWLAFVLEQILSNALKYTNTGGVEIFSPKTDTVCIKDSGIGIEPDDLPRVFERGYTGKTGRREQKSSGLGLYLCKRICRNLGVSLWAESCPGEGTTVFLRFDGKDNKFE